MDVLADTNVPHEYVSALRGDDHTVVYTRDIGALGPEASDADIVTYAQAEGCAILTTDVKDFSDRDVTVPLFVAPQDLSGEEVRRAIARIDALPFDPAETGPLWLSSV